MYRYLSRRVCRKYAHFVRSWKRNGLRPSVGDGAHDVPFTNGYRLF